MANFGRLITIACRTGGAAVLVVAVSGLLGCAGSGQMFSQSTGTPSSSGAKTAPPVTLVELKGLPAEKKQPLTDLLVEAAATHDIAIVQGAFGDGLRLDGSFTVESSKSGTVVGYDWKLADPTGKALQTFSGAEVGPPAKSNGWDAVDAKVLQQIASSTATTLATKLAQMGYSTKAAELTSPAPGTVKASDAGVPDVDYETMYGPQHAVTAAAGEPSAAVTLPSDELTKSGTSKPTRKITAIALVSVSGSPGNGDGQLKEALKQFLTEAGWPVIDVPRTDALIVKGSVAIGAPRGAMQKVALAWSVTAPDGRDLGTIRQSNEVPAGSLDHGWGKMADPAVRSAAEGLFQLVDKIR